MPYTPETLVELEIKYQGVSQELKGLTERLLTKLAPKLSNERAQEYLNHGVCRRLRVIERCIQSIFLIFPPDRKNLLGRDELADVQINLHAFVINLYGVIDNFAWVFVFEHGLKDKIGRRTSVGLFHKDTQVFLPQPLVEYLSEDVTIKWDEAYVKNYRDALAHRIPLYVPPYILSKKNGERWKELDAKIAACIKNHEFEELEVLKLERDSLGLVCDMFSHSFSEAESRSIYIHPQLLSDSATILQMGAVYVEHFAARG